MLQSIEVPFGEWMPDAPPRKAGATVAKGVIAAEGAYRPIPGLTTTATSILTARNQGARAFYDADGNVEVFAGDASKLYRLNGAVFDDKSGATYACPSDAVWQFALYGTKVIAVNPIDNVQFFDFDSSTTFDDLAGSPPKARHVGRIGDFLVLGDIQTAPIRASRVQWCAIGDVENWTINGTNQADYQDLSEDGGRIQGIFNVYETGFIFQERNITRMSYAGLPTVFQFDVVEQNQGSIVGAHAMVQHQSNIFYIGDNGFFVWNGQTSLPISDNKVAAYFLNDLNFTYRHNIFGAFDFTNRAVWWAYPSGSNQYPDKLIIYSIKENRWTYDDSFSLESIFVIPKAGVTLDDLDSISGSLDALPVSLDSSVWLSSAIRIGGFNRSHELVEFTGANRAATLETAEFQPEVMKRVFVNEVWPMVDDDASLTVTAQVGMRDQRLGDTLTYSSASARNATGLCPVRSSGRFGRIRLSLPAGANWTHAEGIQVRYRTEGTR